MELHGRGEENLWVGSGFQLKKKHVPGEKMYYVRRENQVSNVSVFKCMEVTSRKARNYKIYRKSVEQWRLQRWKKVDVQKFQHHFQ